MVADTCLPRLGGASPGQDGGDGHRTDHLFFLHATPCSTYPQAERVVPGIHRKPTINNRKEYRII